MSVLCQTAICIKFPQHVFHLQAAVWKQRHTGYTRIHGSHITFLCAWPFSFHTSEILCTQTGWLHNEYRFIWGKKWCACFICKKNRLWLTAASSRYEKPWASVNECVCVCGWKWKWRGGVLSAEKAACLPARLPVCTHIQCTAVAGWSRRGSVPSPLGLWGWTWCLLLH